MQIVGGFELVRLLGSGRRADVYLGRSASDSPGPPRTAAIKVFRRETSLDSIDAEVDALARVSHRHLLRLDDLTMTEGGTPGLVLQKLDPRPLSRFLLERGELSPGEVVSIVSPVATAVHELHRSGIAHRRLRSATVLFDDTGAPVLSGFGHATVIGPVPLAPDDRSLTAAELADDARALHDVADLCALTRTVVESSAPSAVRDRLLAWLEDARSSCSPDRLPSELAERVFDMGAASAVDLDGSRPPTPSRVDRQSSGATPSGFLQVARPSTASPGPRDRATARPVSPSAPRRVRSPAGSDRLHALRSTVDRFGRTALTRLSESAAARGLGGLLPSSLEPRKSTVQERGTTEGAPGPRSGKDRTIPHRVGLIGTARDALAPVRRSVWVAGGSSMSLLVIALFVVPGAAGEGSAASDRPTLISGPAVRQTDIAPRTSDASSGPPDTVASPPAAVAPLADPGVSASEIDDDQTAGGDDRPEDDGSIEGDDPVAAAGALLAARWRCLDGGPAGCLAEVDQADSAAMDADAYLTDDSGAGHPAARTAGLEMAATLAGTRAVLVQRLGDSAILSLSSESLDSTPASLLLVRGEAGWRIRDLIIG